jgi:hypothetical protein
MAILGLALSAAALVCVALPHPALYLGLASGIVGAVAGWRAYRRQGPANQRLMGVSALGLGAIAALLCGAKYALSLAALSKLQNWLG